MSNATGSGYTTHIQLESRVFFAGPPHHFLQQGMVDTFAAGERLHCQAVQTAELFGIFTAGKGRSVMRGKACGRWIDADGTKRNRALGTAEVLRWVKLVPSHLELQVRRAAAVGRSPLLGRHRAGT